MHQLKAFFQRREVRVVLVWLVIMIGMFLRAHQGDMYPINQNDDGLFYAWTGLSMFKDASNPMSLTIFESEENESLLWRSQYKNFDPVNRFGFRVAEHWFDHPPLGQIAIALPAHLMGYRGFVQLPHLVVRTPALLAAIATLFLTYLLAKELFGFSVGWWSLVILAVWPLAVWSGRQSYLENILNPLWLTGLYGVWRYIREEWKTGLVLAIVVAFLSGWFKLPAFAITGVLVFWLLWGKKRKEALWVAFAGGVSLFLYLLYGTLLYPGSFLSTLTNQGGRGSYLSSLFVALTDVGIYEVIRDGWWFLGLMALASLGASGRKKSLFISLNGLFWVAVIFLTSGLENTSPWYRYPLFPLLAIAMGVVSSRFIAKPTIWWGLWWGVLGLTGWELAGYSISSLYLRLGIILVGLLFVLEHLFNQEEKVLLWQKGVALLLVLLGVGGNALAVHLYPQLHCNKGACLTPERVVIESTVPQQAGK